MDVQSGISAGTVLGGRHHVLEQIGSGAMAYVYRAMDEFLEREVAVKIVTRPRGNDAPHDAEAELKVLARLNHHSLVTLLDAGVDRTEPERPRIYLVMELVEGPDLKRRLADGPLPPPCSPDRSRPRGRPGVHPRKWGNPPGRQARKHHDLRLPP